MRALAGVYDEPLAYVDGSAARHLDVPVYLPGTYTLATLYSDEHRSPVPNPTNTGELGNLRVFAEPGRYEAEIGAQRIPLIVFVHPDEPVLTGTEAASASFIFDMPSLVKSCSHLLPYQPAVTVVDTAGSVVGTDVEYGPGLVVVRSDRSFAGRVYLS